MEKHQKQHQEWIKNNKNPFEFKLQEQKDAKE